MTDMTSPATYSLASAVSSDGATIAYRLLGDPSARPLVLVHGWAQSGACWGPELLAELATRYRVVALDLRGHGHSTVAEAGYDSPAQWADDVEAVLDAAGVSDGAGAILLGWSYGGIVVSDYLAARVTGAGLRERRGVKGQHRDAFRQRRVGARMEIGNGHVSDCAPARAGVHVGRAPAHGEVTTTRWARPAGSAGRR